MPAQIHLKSTHPATYEQLEQVPAGFTVELVGGRLHALPRPRGRHIRLESKLGGRLLPPFDFGEGGPGGWWILDEPEVHFVLDRVEGRLTLLQWMLGFNLAVSLGILLRLLV